MKTVLRAMAAMVVVGGILVLGAGCSDDEIKEAVIGSEAVQNILCETFDGTYGGTLDAVDADGNSVPQAGTIVLNGDCNFAFSSLDPAGRPVSGSGTVSIDGLQLAAGGTSAAGVPFNATGAFAGDTRSLDATVFFQDGTRFTGTLPKS